jgi:putative acetyltransferase
MKIKIVAPQARGTGIGGQLVLCAVNELKARYVDVNEQNSRAVSFYEKMGLRFSEDLSWIRRAIHILFCA